MSVYLSKIDNKFAINRDTSGYIYCMLYPLRKPFRKTLKSLKFRPKVTCQITTKILVPFRSANYQYQCGYW